MFRMTDIKVSCRGSGRVLFIGSLPEPTTGQSLACKVFLDELHKRYCVDVVNLSKASFKQGVNSWARILEVLKILRHVWKSSSTADVIYFTVSQSLAGNAKDLLIYSICFSRLDRMIIHLHGGAGMRQLMRGSFGLTRRLNEFFLKRLAAIIVLGQRDTVVFAGAEHQKDMKIVPNFAEDFLFSHPEQIQAKFDHALPLRILFLSNLLPGKGYTELFESFAALSPLNREMIQIAFAGAFESEAQKIQFLSLIAPFPQLRYHGTVHGEQKRALFSDAHVFCLPTYYPYEGQPISILEAYAAGCAVITTDHSGIFDVFADGINGFAVEKRSVAD